MCLERLRKERYFDKKCKKMKKLSKQKTVFEF